ncbi:MAG TPA: YihY/virulence factor BrkB family protein [Gammaproteobacteria bacterium]
MSPRRPPRGRTSHSGGVRSLLRAAWVEYERDRARYLAVAMVYYALVSLVPLLLLLLSALGLLLRFSVSAAEVEQQVLLAVEASFGAELRGSVERALSSLQEQSIAAMAVSLAGLVLTASVLFRQLRVGFRAIWGLDPPLIAGSLRAAMRATLVERIVAFAMVLGGGVLLVVAIALITVSQWFDRWLGTLPLVGVAAGWLPAAGSSLLLAAITFTVLFKVLPPVRVRWRDIGLAVLLCASAWVAAGELLALSGDLFGASSVAGALGSLLAAMLWLNAVSQLLFFGAEVCKVSAARGRPERPGSPGDDGRSAA